MPKYSITLANQQRLVRIDRRRMIRLACSALAREQVAFAEISVAIVDDPRIHAINREFLKHDYPTDVISFLLDGDDSTEAETSAPGLFTATRGLDGTARNRANDPLPSNTIGTDRRALRIIRRGAGKVIGGEIVMSAQTAARAAGDYDTSPQDELALYLVHGLLHLCGYDDLTPREKSLMRRREAEALQDWNIASPG